MFARLKMHHYKSERQQALFQRILLAEPMKMLHFHVTISRSYRNKERLFWRRFSLRSWRFWWAGKPG